ncbi:MAG TPA: retropepsin-like aspartic protease [Acetobacteraceae bacterium]|jgi:predicted aspartyl protease|nr:retropepsin-like aspartic protease [Acetobacteraceae bacterium]
MRRLLSRLALLPLLAVAACGSGTPRYGAACRVEKSADLPLRNVDNFLFAPVSIGGETVLLVVDTGAETTLLTPEMVARIGLVRDANRRSVLLGVAGAVTSENVVARDLRVGTIDLGDTSLGVGAIAPIPALGVPLGGLLGTDILGRYDVEIDAPARRMTLFTVTNCRDFAPWDGHAIAIPALLTSGGRLFVPAAVDRQPVRAQLDTGARNSLVTQRVANRVGVSDRVLAGDPVRFGHGVGEVGIALRRHRFDRITVGGLSEDNVELNVADTRLPGVEMLLGADWLSGKRIWISFARKVLFVQPPVRSAGSEAAAG